jgi:hypothetical protein
MPFAAPLGTRAHVLQQKRASASASTSIATSLPPRFGSSRWHVHGIHPHSPTPCPSALPLEGAANNYGEPSAGRGGVRTVLTYGEPSAVAFAPSALAMPVREDTCIHARVAGSDMQQQCDAHGLPPQSMAETQSLPLNVATGLMLYMGLVSHRLLTTTPGVVVPGCPPPLHPQILSFANLGVRPKAIGPVIPSGFGSGFASSERSGCQ